MKRLPMTLASLVAGVVLTGVAYAVSAGLAARGDLPTVTPAELAAGDGKDGRPCLVAVDGMVYLIEDSPLWEDGEHPPSDGEARCGADLTEVFHQSPHSPAKLDPLEPIGTLP